MINVFDASVLFRVKLLSIMYVSSYQQLNLVPKVLFKRLVMLKKNDNLMQNKYKNRNRSRNKNRNKSKNKNKNKVTGGTNSSNLLYVSCTLHRITSHHTEL